MCRNCQSKQKDVTSFRIVQRNPEASECPASLFFVLLHVNKVKVTLRECYLNYKYRW